VRAANEEASSKIDEIKEAIQDGVENLKDAVNPNKEKGNLRPEGGARSATMSRDPKDPQAAARAAADTVSEAVGGVVDKVQNALGGNKGFDLDDSTSTQGNQAYTTPQRESLKQKFASPTKNAAGDKPPQKTLDLDNPFKKAFDD
jgi:hypothetical protein